MASAKDLRKRIASVRNTQQITKAMKMVAAAKLRRAQDAIVNLRPYAGQLTEIVQNLVASGQDLENRPLLRGRPDKEAERILVIVVTSDRGLCGGFNANVIKAAQRYMRSHAHKYKKFELGFVGKKGYEFFKSRTTHSGRYYQNFFTGINFAKSQGLAEELIKAYLSEEFDEIKFIYNEFKSAITQKVTVENFLPLRIDSQLASAGYSRRTIYEPNRDVVIDRLLPRHFATQIHRMFLDSLASEHGARMAAMENASKNAGEMIHQLNLEYNKSRQAGITKELLEIISGVESQKN